MALTIAHPFVSTVPEGSKSGTPGGLVGPTEWNANHNVSGAVDASVGARTLLTGNVTYYVNLSTGSDSNPGTLGSPWATPQRGMDIVSQTLDTASFIVTISIAAGTYAPVVLKNILGGGAINFIGASVSTVKIQATFDALPSVTCDASAVGTYFFDNLTLDGSTFGGAGTIYDSACIALITNTRINLFVGVDAMNPGATGNFGFITSNNNLYIAQVFGPGVFFADTSGSPATNITITGTVAASYLGLDFQACAQLGGAYTLANTLAIDEYFVEVHDDSFLFIYATFTGTATGSRFIADTFGLIQAFGAAPTYFPGSIDGRVIAGGQYLGFKGRINTPTTGDTVAIAPWQEFEILTPATALATLTVDLPPIDPNLGYSATVRISTTETITALTVATTDGTSIVAAPTTLVVEGGANSTAFEMYYDPNTNTWFPVDGGGVAQRTILLANTTYYVNSSTGSDSDNGLATGTAFATLQHAQDFLSNTLDGNNFILTIQCAGAGPYTMDAETSWVNMQCVAILGAGSGTTEFSNFSWGFNNSFSIGCTVYIDSCKLTDTGINPVAPTLGNCIYTIASGGAIAIGGINNDVTVGPASKGDIKTTGPASEIQLYGTITFLTGTHVYGLYAGFQGSIGNASAIVQSGTPAYNAFMFITEGALFNDYMGSNSYSGACTGLQYNFVTGGLYTGDSTRISGGSTGVLIDGYDPDFVTWTISTPSTGNTISMVWLDTTLKINPAGVLAALTIHLPPVPAVSGLFGYAIRFKEFDVSTTQAVTAVTWATTDGSSIANGFPSAFTAGQEFFPTYIASTNTWYP